MLRQVLSFLMRGTIEGDSANATHIEKTRETVVDPDDGTVLPALSCKQSSW
jgi:hypothetical protein